MKVLYLHHNQPDYLGESLFHGLRRLLGQNCVDIPRYDSMYAPLTDRIRYKLRGNGFTLYGLLEDIPALAEDRYFWQNDLDKYDLIIIANIYSQWHLVWQLLSVVPAEKLVILDGSDSPAFFPYVSLKWRMINRPWSYFTPLSNLKYFKRELIGEGHSYGLDRFLPYSLRYYIPFPKNAKPISFSIPEEKIRKVDFKQKVKDFPTHIVDAEVSAKVREAFFSDIGSDKYIFSSEEEYYNDLRKSRFGITTKRAGWDCFRHYELAANGCVLCFKDLDLKPEICAPHGLNESNCIIYHSYNDLIERISAITDDEYCRLQDATYQWIESNTTVVRAKYFLNSCSIS
ncbi:MAG: glycosyltransferase family 1 protein [Nostoc sp.]|uniref:glycosyltransferase family 1 protein n=1 Tax=Nostoc sp. TaxID=1180 RepID=UPI002FF72D71